MSLLSSAGHADRATALGNTFIDRVARVSTAAELRNLMEDMCRELGFRRFAMIHHDDLRFERPGLININNYPDAWADIFIGQRLYMEDPVVHACLRSNAGFCWSELERIIRLNERQREILAAAARQGLKDGITIPACVLGEPTGSCSLCCPTEGVDPSRCILLAQFVGAFGFSAARRLAAGGAISLPSRPRLMPRQRECVILAGQGKSNWEIGTILGLSRVTVKHYLEDAFRQYDVVSRTQLVICALLSGEIGFPELTPSQYVHLAG